MPLCGTDCFSSYFCDRIVAKLSIALGVSFPSFFSLFALRVSGGYRIFIVKLSRGVFVLCLVPSCFLLFGSELTTTPLMPLFPHTDILSLLTPCFLHFHSYTFSFGFLSAPIYAFVFLRFSFIFFGSQKALSLHLAWLVSGAQELSVYCIPVTAWKTKTKTTLSSSQGKFLQFLTTWV